MTEEVHTGRGRTLTIVAWIAGPAVALLLLLYLTLRGGSGPVKDRDPTTPGKDRTHYLAQARTDLAKQADPSTCRAAIEKLNSHLNEAPEHAPRPLGSAEVK